MEAPRPADLIEFTAQAGHAVADHAPVGFDLGFARTAEEAETAALPLKVGPAADQSSGLVVKVGQFDLQATFRRRRPLPENLEDQAGPVDHLALQLFFQIALLDRGERAIDDDQFSLALGAGNVDVLDLPFPEQGASPRLADRDGDGIDHFQPDGESKTARFFQARGRIDRGSSPAPEFRIHDQGPRSAAYIFAIVVKKTQSSSPSSPSQPSPVRSTGVTG